MQGSHSGRRSAVRSGLLTGLSTAAVSGSAALAGAILSRKFGHGVETDGFFAAYFVYVAVVLVASALRVVVLPEFARAQEAGQARSRGRLLGARARRAARAAGRGRDRRASLGCRAADEQLAGAGERRLAAALAHPGRGAAGLRRDRGERPRCARRLRDRSARVRRRGGRGPRRDRLAGRPRRAGVRLGPRAERSTRARHPARRASPAAAVSGGPAVRSERRLRRLVEGVALPFAIQGLYIVSYRFASGLGSGKPTTLSYAYLISSLLVAVTATSVALVSSVPLSRGSLTPERSARHIVSASWLSLVVVAGAAGVLALAGAPVAKLALGSSYGGTTGTELGRLVAYLAFWMTVSVAFSVAFPLLFVLGRARMLPLLAVAALAVQVPIAWAGSSIAGLAGIAVGLAITTTGILVVLLLALDALVATAARPRGSRARLRR